MNVSSLKATSKSYYSDKKRKKVLFSFCHASVNTLVAFHRTSHPHPRLNLVLSTAQKWRKPLHISTMIFSVMPCHLSCCWNCLHPQFINMKFHVLIALHRSTICGLIIDPHHYQLSVGLIAQLVECCTGIVEVTVWVPFTPAFLSPFLRYCKSSIA